jgi:hypothetical protein
MRRRIHRKGYEYGYGGEERKPPKDIPEGYGYVHDWLVGWDEGASERKAEREKDELEKELCEALRIEPLTLERLKEYLTRS